MVGTWIAPVMTLCPDTIFGEATLEQRNTDAWHHGAGATAMFGMPLVLTEVVTFTVSIVSGVVGFAMCVACFDQQVMDARVCIIAPVTWALYIVSFYVCRLYSQSLHDFQVLDTYRLLGHSLGFYEEQRNHGLLQNGTMMHGHLRGLVVGNTNLYRLDNTTLHELTAGNTTFRQIQNSLYLHEFTDELVLGVGAVLANMVVVAVMSLDVRSVWDKEWGQIIGHNANPIACMFAHLAAWLLLYNTAQDARARASETQQDQFWCACSGPLNATCNVMSHDGLVPSRNCSGTSGFALCFLMIAQSACMFRAMRVGDQQPRLREPLEEGFLDENDVS